MHENGWILVALVSTTLIGATLLFLLIQMQGRRKPKSKRHRLSLMRRMLSRRERTVGQLERCARLLVIHSLLQGKKCKGCNEMVEARDLKSVGENPDGREVLLCRECRKLMGQED